ncbi:MAG TPA: PIN domain-containing protein [Alphaproteobacteria bacterium]|jgi:predicted nucleic acid-binding protein|nr:PIN domain-containing protein [Alphaproteobacteria bacterium]
MENLPEFLHDSTILLDTNFLINAFAHREIYAVFLTKLKNIGVVFVAPNFVKYEFIRSKTFDVVRRKEEYFHQIVDSVLPYDKALDELIIPTIEEYKQKMEGLPLVDLIIAAYLKKYRGLYLLTNDHSDFPTFIFERKHIFNIEDFGDKIYSLYTYKSKTQTIEEEVSTFDDIPF